MSTVFDYLPMVLVVPLVWVVYVIWWISIIRSRDINYEDLADLELFKEASRKTFITKVVTTVHIYLNIASYHDSRLGLRPNLDRSSSTLE